MKRKLFFLFDKLKISRNERMAVSVLMVLLASLLLANTFIYRNTPFNDKYYQKIDSQFKQRTAVLKRKEQAVLARYHGDTLKDTIPGKALVSAVSGVNINEAGLEKLQMLPGVGPTYAQRIIDYRNKNGSFKTRSELLNIKGIGPATLNKMMPYIYIESSSNKSETDQVDHPKIPKTDNADKNNIVPRNQLININTAGKQTLQNLPGIGPAYSQRIISYRRKHGAFKSFSDLLNVKGIGSATLSKMKSLISLGNRAEKIDPSAVNQQHQGKERARNDSGKQAGTSHSLVNINTADAQKLQKLPGIGPAYSHRIIAYRQENGPFKTMNGLLKIKGIGKKTLAKIKPFIKLRE